MIEIRPSRAAELPAQKELWKTSFGDDSSFINLFYKHYCKPEDMLVLVEDGVLRSMAAILPLDLRFPNGLTGKSGYIYALCTHPSFRNRGFVRDLLNYTDFYLKKRGKDCATLVPADAGLHRFFDIQGFGECFSHRKVEIAAALLPTPPEHAEAAPVDPEEYGRIRERLLAGQFHLSYDKSLLAFQRAGSHMFGGDLYRFAIGDTEGCAVAEYFGTGRVLIKELLIPPNYMAQATALLARVLPASYYYLRTPSFWEGLSGSYIQAFGMVKWYDPCLERLCFRERQGYLGLGFD